MSEKTELDWVADCYDSPMYAAEYIVKLEATIAELRKAITFMLDEATNYPMNLRSDGPFDALAAALDTSKGEQ